VKEIALLSLLYGGTKAADLATTEYALRRAGTYEANALLRDRATRIAVSAGVVVGEVWLTRRARGRWKTALKILIPATHAGLAVWNVRQARRA
jgi:hypothetical protein